MERSIVTDVVGQGSTAGRFDLPASSQRALARGSEAHAESGRRRIYGMMFRLPKYWRKPSRAGWGLALVQPNDQRIWGAPVLLAAHANRVSLVTQTGNCNDGNPSRPGCTHSSGPGGSSSMRAISSISPGSWHEPVSHERWVADSSGAVHMVSTQRRIRVDEVRQPERPSQGAVAGPPAA